MPRAAAGSAGCRTAWAGYRSPAGGPVGGVAAARPVLPWSVCELAQCIVERRRGRRREDELAMVAVDLARRRLIAAVEAADRGDREALRRRTRQAREMIEQVQRAPALTGAGADPDRHRGGRSDAQLGRQRHRGQIMTG